MAIELNKFTTEVGKSSTDITGMKDLLIKLIN